MDMTNIKKIITGLSSNISKMNTYEYMLFNKWCEINNAQWNKSDIWEIKNQIWYGNNIEETIPYIKIVEKESDNKIWKILNTFTSIKPYRERLGRSLKILIYDRLTSCIIGSLSLSSDHISLNSRDDFIGWSFDQRIKKKRMNFTARVDFNYINPLDPTFMHYFLINSEIINLYNRKYEEEPIVGITSICDKSDSVLWDNCGSTKINMQLTIPNKLHNLTKTWLEKRYPNDFKSCNDVFKKTLEKLCIKPKLKKDIDVNVYFC